MEQKTTPLIMHVDMDAFYASIEQHDHPELIGRPVIVGTGRRSVVSACSYEARAFGVRSGMPLFQALQRCPQAVCMPVRRARYVEVSKIVQSVLQDISPYVEQASIDEAYLDITGLARLFGDSTCIAYMVKERIFTTTGGLRCSVGVAPIKFLAKIASDMNKPDGLYIIQQQDIHTFLHHLPVKKIPGVGKQFLAQLSALGVQTCGQVTTRPQSFWERRFGKPGHILFQRACGIDPRAVEPYTEPKSESAECTLEQDTADKERLQHYLFIHADRVGRSLRKQHRAGRVVTLKIKYADFRQITRQISLSTPTCATETIFEHACTLLNNLELTQSVRLVGLGISGFHAPPQQLLLPLGNEPQNQAREEQRNKLDKVLDALEGKVNRGRLFFQDKEQS